MNRSKTCVLVSHCILAQGVMAEGLVKIFPAVFKPVLKFCMDHDINVFQMPCPELCCEAGGLGRQARGKAWYEKEGLRQISRRIAEEQVASMIQLTQAGFTVLAIIGVEFSPACAVGYLNRGRSIVKDKGIYVEELQRTLGEEGLDVAFIGVHHRWVRKLEKELRAMLE